MSEESVQTVSQVLSEALMNSGKITAMVLSYVIGDPTEPGTTIHNRWCGGHIVGIGLAHNLLNHLQAELEDTAEEDTE